MSSKNRKKISEEEEEKYRCGTPVMVILHPQAEGDAFSLFWAQTVRLEVRDGHRTLEAITTASLDDEAHHDPLRLTLTRWKRTWPRWTPCPTLHAHEWLEGWF